jgi:hypothetical protein
VFGNRGDVVDTHGHFHDAYGLAPNSWVLVRPDGYVGAFIAGDEIDALHAYLQGVGISLAQPMPQTAQAGNPSALSAASAAS